LNNELRTCLKLLAICFFTCGALVCVAGFFSTLTIQRTYISYIWLLPLLLALVLGLVGDVLYVVSENHCKVTEEDT
jgi:hypothetical protein